MSASAINITSPMAPAAAGGAGKAAGGLHAGFDALMEAFFASTGEVLQTTAATALAGAAGQAAAGQVAAEPAGTGLAAAQAATGQAAAGGQFAASELVTAQLVTTQLVTGPVAADVPVDAAAALLIEAAQAAGAPPADAKAAANDARGPKLPNSAAKPPAGDAGKLVGQAAAADPAQPAPVAAASDTAATIDASALVAAETKSSDEAGETPPPAEALTSAQMATVMALMTPTPAPTPASAKSAAPPPPPGSSPPASTADASPLPAAAVPAPPAPAAPAAPTSSQIPAEPKLDLLADKTPDAPAPDAAPAAQAATAKAESIKTASAPAADVPTPAPAPPPFAEPAPPPTAQAAAASPAPSTPAADKPAKATRAAREEATPNAAAAAAPAVRPGPASTVEAVGQSGANKDPGHGSAGADAPQAAQTPVQAADPQLAADPTAQQPAASATSTAHAAAPAAARATPETVANLAGQIVKKLGARSTQFDLQLDPAGLGKVNVRVEINADGRVSAAMSFDTPQAAAELKSRANELQRALAQSGFDVTGGLSFDVTQDQGRGAGQQNAFQDNDNPGRAFRGRAFAAALETAGDAAQAALIDRRQTPSGVDVRI